MDLFRDGPYLSEAKISRTKLQYAHLFVCFYFFQENQYFKHFNAASCEWHILSLVLRRILHESSALFFNDRLVAELSLE